ncbi:tetratricopeptide repeat protein, partial [bacterium]|nr:tetratricopeptide repeat protein [candidate division CSSED10-310 bacterium]
DAPPPLRFLNPEVPPELDAVVGTLLQKEPQNRFRSAQEVISRLEEMLARGSDDRIDLDRTIQVSLAEPVASSAPQLLEPLFVGRDDEMGCLRRRLEYCRQGEGAMVLLGGESGIGKSRMLDEFGEYLGIQRVKMIRSACPEIERFPYQAFYGLFEYVLQLCRKGGMETLERLMGQHARVIEAIYPMFGEIEGLAALPPLVKLEPYQDKLRAFDAILGVFRKLSGDNLFVFVIDDLQWSDELSLEMLDYLFRNMGGGRFTGTQPLPIMLIGAYREEELKANHPLLDLMRRFSRSERFERLKLNRLNREQFVVMITSMTGYKDWDDRFIDQIYQESEGNPFFTTEILKALIDEGVVRIGAEGLKIADLDLEEMIFETRQDTGSSQLLKIPGSIVDLISRRLDRIGEEAKRVLSQAAVMGLVFNFDVLMRITESDEDFLLDVLDELLKQRLIEEQPGEQDNFRFQHEMIRRILYANTSLRRRRHVHRKIGYAMEELQVDTQETNSDALAYHFYHAGVNLKAIEYMLQASIKAREEFRNEDAVNYARLALDLIDRTDYGTDGKKMILHRQAFLDLRARVLTHVGKFEEAREVTEMLLATTREMEDPTHLTEALLNRGFVDFHLGRFDSAADWFQQALALTRSCALVEKELTVLISIGSIYQQKGEYAEALSTFEKVRDQARQWNDRERLSAALINLGVIYYSIGEYDKSLSCYMESLESYRKARDRARELKAINNIGGIYHYRGDVQAATCWYGDALKLAESIGDRVSAAAILSNLGVISYEKGEYSKSAAYQEKALHISREIGDRQGCAYSLINLGITRQHEGQLKTVLELYQESLRISKDIGDRPLAAYNLFWIGRNHHLGHLYDQTGEFYNQAFTLAEELNMKRLEALINAYRGLLAADLGTPGEGIAQCRAALREGERLGDQETVILARFNIARILLRQQAAEQVGKILAPAVRIIRKNDLKPYQWTLLWLLGRALHQQGRLTAAAKTYKLAVDTVLALMRDVEDRLRGEFIERTDIRALIDGALAVMEEVGDQAGMQQLRAVF